ncbi:hypothetical protein GCM10010505_42020 [Kitasatospora aburaviensis]
MKFLVEVDGDRPLVVVYEPSGEEWTLSPGHWIVVEWPNGDEGRGEIRHTPDSITLSEPLNAKSRVWDSQGNRLW